MRWLVVLIIFIFGCQSQLPQKKKNINNYNLFKQIPSESVLQYPQDCEWAELVRVIDGDTIEVKLYKKNIEIRYLGIDTPEVNSPYTDLEFFGTEASDKNAKLLTPYLCLMRDNLSNDIDIYDRYLRHVFNDQGIHINLQLVCQGFAKVSRYPVSQKSIFRNCEKVAKKSSIGLWQKSIKN